MKNKIKKAIATIGLGVVGCASLAGCSLSGDQQATIDSLFDKADGLTNKLEQVLDNQNKQYSRQDIVDKIMLTRLNFSMANYNNVHCLIKLASYNDFFADSQDEELPIYMNSYYRYKNNVKCGASLDNNGKVSNISVKDYNNDIEYTWVSAERTGEATDRFQLLEDKEEMPAWTINQLDVFSQLASSVMISENDIRDIKVDGDKISFKIIQTRIDEEDDAYFENILYVEYTGDYLTSVKGSTVKYDYSESGFKKDEEGNMCYSALRPVPATEDFSDVVVTSTKLEAYYEFEDIDYSVIDTKISVVEAKYLYNND